MHTVRVERVGPLLRPDPARVITRPMDLRNPRRVRSLVARVMALDDRQVSETLATVRERFLARHEDIEAVFLDHFRRACDLAGTTVRPAAERRLLIGACLTMEYSIESAGLFNPAIVPHPDQGGLEPGAVRFLLSLRAVGEQHISSIVFRKGAIDAACRIHFAPVPKHTYCPRPEPNTRFDKALFLRQFVEMGGYKGVARLILDAMPDPFTRWQLQEALGRADLPHDGRGALWRTAAQMRWLAHANYELQFPPGSRPAQAVIFPATEPERHGMEDLRLVCFHEPDGARHYYGTYTAYDGLQGLPMLLDTRDFTVFRISTMGGRYVRDKGMALFPRRVRGRYAAISRHDGENLFVLTSDDVRFWNQAHKLQQPAEPWELLQLGNCGSPIETEAGWLLLTHGVGPVRQYCIGAVLLDRDEPTRVLGRLRDPLIVPSDEEREGYVPNVVYSCGSMIHHGRLIVPYAMSDNRTGFCVVSVDELLAALLHSGP
jgi:predicted GH43/DUF377 family glycosyl hydrolase